MRRNYVVDTFFGTKVKDPYRWLEDPNFEKTKKFVDEQNEVSMAYIASCDDRDKIVQRIGQLTGAAMSPAPSPPSKHGNNYFFTMKPSDGQGERVMYKQVGSLQAEPLQFLKTSLGSFASFSEDGAWCAYSTDANAIKVRNVTTGDDVDDTLDNVPFEWGTTSAASWSHDNAGFFYCVSCFPLKSSLLNESCRV